MTNSPPNDREKRAHRVCPHCTARAVERDGADGLARAKFEGRNGRVGRRHGVVYPVLSRAVGITPHTPHAQVHAIVQLRELGAVNRPRSVREHEREEHPTRRHGVR
jgi:hypothetical protein